MTRLSHTAVISDESLVKKTSTGGDLHGYEERE